MNCKPGDLAYVVGGLCNPSPNLGQIVEVVSLYGVHPVYGSMWRCKARSPVQTRSADGGCHLKIEYASADAWLRPISGVPVHDEVTEEVSA